MRVVGRRQWQSESREAQRLDFYGVNFGLKLPTGDTDVQLTADWAVVAGVSTRF